LGVLLLSLFDQIRKGRHFSETVKKTQFSTRTLFFFVCFIIFFWRMLFTCRGKEL